MLLRSSLVALLFVVGSHDWLSSQAYGQVYAQQGTRRGAVAGAIVGGMVGGKNNRPILGAVVGGVAGGLVGRAIGERRDANLYQQYYGQPFQHQGSQPFGQPQFAPQTYYYPPQQVQPTPQPWGQPFQGGVQVQPGINGSVAPQPTPAFPRTQTVTPPSTSILPPQPQPYQHGW